MVTEYEKIIFSHHFIMEGKNVYDEHRNAVSNPH